MALDPDQLDDDVLTFLRERHLATLTTLRTDGSPHVVAVGFSYDADGTGRTGDHVGDLAEGDQRRSDGGCRPAGGRVPGRRRDGGSRSKGRFAW